MEEQYSSVADEQARACRFEEYIPLSALLYPFQVNTTALDALTWKMSHPSTEETSLLSAKGIEVDLLRTTYGEDRIISTPRADMWSYHIILAGEMKTPISFLFRSLSVNAPNARESFRFTNKSVVLRVQIADIETSGDVAPFEILDLNHVFEEAPELSELLFMGVPPQMLQEPVVVRGFQKSIISSFDKHNPMTPPGGVCVSLGGCKKPSKRKYYEGGGIYMGLNSEASSGTAYVDGESLEPGQICIMRPDRCFEYQCEEMLGVLEVSPYSVGIYRDRI